MLRCSRRRLRGYFDPEPTGGHNFGFTAARMGGTPRIAPAYSDLTHQQPQRPLRAEAPLKNLPPVLYSKQDQLMEIHNALVTTRTALQVKNAMGQLGLAVRNADTYIKDIVMKDKRGARPHMYDMVFSRGGLQEKEHVLSCLPTHQMIPILSLISFDYEQRRIDLVQVEAVVHALADTTVGHSKMVQRELFNQYIRCCALDGNVEKAFGAVREMKNKNIRRNFVSYAPLFRLARKNMDADLHIAVTDLACDVEGGMMRKLVLLDVPRLFSVSVVFFRFYWPIISTMILVTGGLCTAFFVVWLGIT